MENECGQHIRELAGLIKSGGVTEAQKKALVVAIVAVRKGLRDRGYNSQPLEDDGTVTDATSVYKYYDNRNILIYVGITSGGILRNRQHNDSKEWWKFVSRQEVEHFKNRDLAHKREVQLIEVYRPPFNKQHNKDHANARRFYLELANGRISPKVLHSKKNLLLAEQLM